MNKDKKIFVASNLKSAVVISVLSLALLGVALTQNGVGAFDEVAKARFAATEPAPLKLYGNVERWDDFTMLPANGEQTAFDSDYKFAWVTDYFGRNDTQHENSLTQTNIYTFKNSGRCLDIEGVSTGNGAKAHQFDCHTGDNQKWEFFDDKNGYYWLRAKHSGKCLDIEQQARNNGAKTHQWDCHTGDSQKWRLIDFGSGYYGLWSKSSGRCLDIEQQSKQNGGKAHIWDCHSGDSQKWQLTLLGGGGKSNYLGCFRDKPERDLNGFLERSQSNTPQRCVATCRAKGFKYAAVQYGSECFCGNSYGKYGAANNCDMKCTGDSGQICGGYYANSIWKTE